MERLEGTEYWVGDKVMYKGTTCTVDGVSWDPDAGETCYEVGVPVGNKERYGSIQFCRCDRAYARDLEPAKKEKAVS